jgi:hypothetical protein
MTAYLITSAGLLLLTAAFCAWNEWEFRRFRRRIRAAGGEAGRNSRVKVRP